MPKVDVNGVGLFYQAVGGGEPLVLVHGSWGDHHNWDPVVHGLASTHRVFAYDRRGHSQSDRTDGPGSRYEDEEDLAALMEALGVAPARVVGSSFGASVVIGLAARRPGLFRRIVVHEPPLLEVVPDVPELRAMMTAAGERIDGVLDLLRKGDYAAGARRFVEEVAFGPGMWDQIPQRLRETFLTNAPTFLDEQADPDWAAVDLERLHAHAGPVLLTRGTESPPFFGAIVDRLAETLPGARCHVFAGAGHIPHISHPTTYVDLVNGFLEQQAPAAYA
ncbi:alpha/beta fold hydrolase [Streptomyces sp. NPDC058877]|uniref:alpha/beta fold hydrolase n=1 Tax=Streptomyces sp. NPDC058877 TaxID=3346665 RepID=UPI0036B5019F